MRRQTQWEDDCVELEADIGVRPPPAEEYLGAQKLEETRKNPLKAWRKYDQHRDVILLASRAEMKNFCCFKPPGLWCFVMAALGN